MLRLRCRRRSLSQRVSQYNQRTIGETDALAEEVLNRLAFWCSRRSGLHHQCRERSAHCDNRFRRVMCSAMVQVKSLQRALQDAQKDATIRQEAAALQELSTAQQVVRGLGPGGDL